MKQVISHLSHHGESNQEADGADNSNKDFFVMVAPQEFWVQVNTGGDEALHTNKLKGRENPSRTITIKI